MVHVLDIYLLRVPLKKCNDIRPCIVTSITENQIAVMALVSASGLKRRIDFAIKMDHPDFSATGLKRDSYVLADTIAEAPLHELNVFLGRLEKQLAREFRDWYGM
jgi:mRNA-degrading endonuclease toxin of MazEF toxin-antitoxin module